MNKEKRVLSSHASTKAVYFYNMLGSLCNATFYMILLMVVNRLSGEYEGGVLAIGYAIASLTWAIGSFETGTYQATDAKNSFEFGHYFSQKILTCMLMMVISMGIACIRGGSSYEQVVIILLCLFKALDAWSGLYYAQLQKYGRLDIAGKSLCIRIVLSMVLIIGILGIGANLIPALAAACFTELIWIVLYEMRLVETVYGLKPVWDYWAIRKITWDCMPLFISAFLITFLTNLPKYVMDIYYPPEMQAVFSSLFMPAAVINLLSLFVFRPSLTKISGFWAKKNIAEFCRWILRFMEIIGGLTIFAMAFAWFMGTQVLSFIYGVELRSYRLALVLIMLGGGFSATSTFLNYMLVIVRKQQYVMLGNLISFALSMIICVPLVYRWGMTGAALLYTLAMMVIGITMMGVVYRVIRKQVYSS